VNERRFVVALFATSLLTRLLTFGLYLMHNQRYWQVDSLTYHLVAQGIAAGKGIALPTGALNFYRLPGYPMFLANFYKIWGPDSVIALWVQTIIAAFIPVIIYFLARTLFPTKPLLARCASAYSAIHLGLVLYSGFFMTESLFITCFLLFCLFFFKAVLLQGQFAPLHSNLRTPLLGLKQASIGANGSEPPDHHEGAQRVEGAERTNIVYAGLWLGAASLIRPVGHYLLVVALGIIVLSVFSWRQKLRTSCALLLAWLAVVLPWLLRNYLLLGHLFFHTLPGGHFLYLSAARVAMHVHNCSYQEARELLQQQVEKNMAVAQAEQVQPLNEIERCHIHERLARHYFISHPVITLKTWCTDMMRTCLSLYSAELLYLENGRQDVDYFAKGRGWWSLFERYLFPQTHNLVLIALVYAEIIMYLFILIGCVGALFYGARILRDETFGFSSGRAPHREALAIKTGARGEELRSMDSRRLIEPPHHERNSTALTLSLSKGSNHTSVQQTDTRSLLLMLPFIALFIIIALAGGYARMRLPAEPFLIMLGLYFWLSGKDKKNEQI